MISCSLRWAGAAAALAILGACTSSSRVTGLTGACQPSTQFDPRDVPGCLQHAGIVSRAAQQDGDSVLADAQHFVDSISPAPATMGEFIKRSETIRAMNHLSDYYWRGLLRDSARYDRIVDHIAVTLEYERGLKPVQPLRFRPKRTPGLTWVYYANLGIYFQPVTSVQSFEFNFPAPWVSTDSLAFVGNALYHYAIWHRGKSGPRFPVWEYNFAWNSGGWTTADPWHSGMAQGLALLVFTQLYDRTHDALWKTRAYDTYNSYKVSWDDYGAMMPDTSQGYWWEEYAPVVQVWNGSVTALLELDYFAKVFHDAEAARMVASGIQAVKYYTPRYYDTGFWMNYSRTQGWVSQSYMNYHVTLADTLFARTGDSWFQTFAQKIHSYTAPTGVYDFVPFMPSPNATSAPDGLSALSVPSRARAIGGGI